MAKPTRLTQDMIDDYLRRGLWDEMSIPDVLRQNAARYPHEEALVDSKTRYTWADLEEITTRLAFGLLDSGMKRDQALVIQLPSSTIPLIVLLAGHKIGILSCFAPMTFRHNELRYILDKLKAAAVITPTKYRGIDYFSLIREIAPDVPHLRHCFVVGNDTPPGALSLGDLIDASQRTAGLEAVLPKHGFNPFEVSMIVLSSGTTGMPKCIEHTGASSRAAGLGIVERAKLSHEDIIGLIAPLSGGPGLQNWWAAFHVGSKVCLLERFSPEGALQLIEKEKVTYLAAIPAQIARIVKECDLSTCDLSSLRVVRTGAAAFDPAMARETEEKMNCTVIIAAGSQETYSFAQSGVDDPREKRVTTLGKPFPGNEIKIVDENGRSLKTGEVGELCVRGAATSSGYWGDPDVTLAAWGAFGNEGWFNTGDLARLDPEGYLSIVGRKKDMIVRGGQNIYPAEIENLLLTHPNVVQAVVIGMPDPVMGERACACLKTVGGAAFTFDEMVTFLKKQGLAVHKLPEKLLVMTQMPQLADGQKVDRRALTERILEKIKAEGGT